MIHKLPELPYAFNALEPYIDARTMELHYTKHHQAYLDNFNAALKNHPDLQEKSVTDLLKHLDTIPEDVRIAIRNQGGGYLNHSMFWFMMTPHGPKEPKGKVAEEIKKTFGDFSIFKEKFNLAAKSVFGSGWAWLVIDKSGKLAITSTPNQDSPFSQGQAPILGLDVWEHAYYLHYQNRRPEYIDAWWHVVSWEQVEENFILHF